jgi:D-amino-acid dehydrogenase
MKKITIIGAGIVGIATAAYLRRDGHEVTVIDRLPPGEYTSFGNAGILSPGSCVPIAMPGIMSKVPGYLTDPMGPLKVRWSYFPQALPWLFRFVTSTALRNVEKTADALISLLSQTFDAHGPLAQHANCSDIIRKTGYVVVYDTDQAYRKDALAWKLRRDRGVVCTEIDAAGIAKLVPALARNLRARRLSARAGLRDQSRTADQNVRAAVPERRRRDPAARRARHRARTERAAARC